MPKAAANWARVAATKRKSRTLASPFPRQTAGESPAGIFDRIAGTPVGSRTDRMQSGPGALGPTTVASARVRLTRPSHELHARGKSRQSLSMLLLLLDT